MNALSFELTDILYVGRKAHLKKSRLCRHWRRMSLALSCFIK